ncbi:MAG: hypothetical protein LZF60_130031 [Nitrospira sp.]|nr:MAG: hypothetical protein LZF60_130031 [Nitrospira sp.]
MVDCGDNHFPHGGGVSLDAPFMFAHDWLLCSVIYQAFEDRFIRAGFTTHIIGRQTAEWRI